MKPISNLPKPNATARELLVYVAGESHQFHSIFNRDISSKGVVHFTCSCGEEFEVEVAKEVMAALRNVPMAS